MKNLSISAIAVAALEVLGIPGCAEEKINDVRGNTSDAVMTIMEKPANYPENYKHELWRSAVAYEDKAAELWLKVAKIYEEQDELCMAADIYERAGDEIKAKELYLQDAQRNEQAGYFSTAARSYKNAGDEVKAKEMWLKEAQEMERRATKSSHKHETFQAASEAYNKAGNPIKADEMRRRASLFKSTY